MQLDEVNKTSVPDRDPDDARSEFRFFIDGEATETTLTYMDADGKPQIGQGRLSDLSSQGVKVSVNRRIPKGTTGILKVFVPSMDFEICRDVVVRWQQPRDGKTWWTGCQVPDGFDAAMIEGLAASKVLNRRRDPRYQVSKPAKIRWELADSDEDATVTNFSKGGFCVRLPSGATDRTRLMLIVPRDDTKVTIPARVMWQNNDGKDNWVGCAFTTKDGFTQLRHYAEPPERRRQRHKRLIRRRRPMSKWLAIAVLVLAAVQTIHTVIVVPDAPQRVRQVWTDYVVEPVRQQLLRITTDESDADEEPASDPSPADDS